MSTERRYRLDWIRDDKGTRGILFPGPLTARECRTLLARITRYPWRRVLMVEVSS